jgi:hypothetical protein
MATIKLLLAVVLCLGMVACKTAGPGGTIGGTPGGATGGAGAPSNTSDQSNQPGVPPSEQPLPGGGMEPPPTASQQSTGSVNDQPLPDSQGLQPPTTVQTTSTGGKP